MVIDNATAIDDRDFTVIDNHYLMTLIGESTVVSAIFNYLYAPNSVEKYPTVSETNIGSIVTGQYHGAAFITTVASAAIAYGMDWRRRRSAT